MPKGIHRDPVLRRAIGKRIRKCRTLKGWSMRKLAMATNLDASQIRQIELGLPGLSIETLFAIAAALNMTAAKLLGEDYPTT